MNEELKMNFPEFNDNFDNVLGYCKRKSIKRDVTIHSFRWGAMALLVLFFVVFYFVNGNVLKGEPYYHLDDIKPTTYIVDEDKRIGFSWSNHFSPVDGDIYEKVEEEDINPLFIELLNEYGIEYKRLRAHLWRFNETNEIHVVSIGVYFEYGEVIIIFDVSNYPKSNFDTSDTYVIGNTVIKKDVGDIVSINEYDVIVTRFFDWDNEGKRQYTGYQVGIRKEPSGFLLRESGNRLDELEKIFNIIVNEDFDFELITNK